MMISYNSIGQNVLPDEVEISYFCKHKPLKTVLNELSQKSKVSINFNPRRIPGNSKVTISAKKQRLGTILNVILNSRRCKYEIIGNQIVISRNKLKDKDRDLTISGYLSDDLSGEMLVGANVYLFDKSKGTQTNEYGFYSITLNKGTKRMYYSYLGYTQLIEEIYLQQDTVLDVSLKPDVLLNEVIILDDVENQEEPNTFSESKLNIDRILTSNSLGGEGDIIRLIGMMPGVSSGADGLGGINVRGGSADQNLVLLDGVPVYNVGHALGVFSIFNSNVIKNAKLIKGNIPARYGGRLSSVLDIRTREGNNKKLSGDVTLSALAAKATIEGPIGKAGSSYIFSMRRTYLDPWIKALTKFQNDQNGDDGYSSYYFMDFNGKLSFKLNKKNSLFINSFYGKDVFLSKKSSFDTDGGTSITNDSGTDWNWGNNLFSIKLTSQYSNKTFGRLTAYYTKYNFNSFEFDSFNLQDSISEKRVYKAGYFKSGINDYGIKYDFDYIPNTTHLLRTGIGLIRHDFSPGLVSITNADDIFDTTEEISETKVKLQISEPKILGYELYGFLEDELSFDYGTTINFGLHSNLTKVDTTNYLSLQPRIALLSKWDNGFFKVGVSRMSQFLHLLSSNGLGLPTDVWLPSTNVLAPEKSWITTVGFGYYNAKGYRFGIEGYYKQYDDLTTYAEGNVEPISADTNWEKLLPVGNGNAYGLEFYFDRIIGRTTWNANYTLAFSNRNFKKINNDGETFDFRYNRKHSVKIGFLHKITDNTEFVLNWELSSGNPIAGPSGDVILLETPDGPILTVVFSERNVDKLPLYHRLDFGFNFYNKYKWGRTKLSLGVYNAFNRSNPFYIDIQNTAKNPNKFQKVEYSILPLIPSIGYSVSF